MLWKEQAPDVTIHALGTAMRRLDCGSAMRLHANIAHGHWLYISPACAADVDAHVASDRDEVGGLLLGEVWARMREGQVSGQPVVWVRASLASEKYRNSRTSLEMGTEIWDRARARSPELAVVGWYHSHPNLGAFFSGTDRRTQRAFFSQRYSVGWVIDPVRKEERVFAGGDSDEYFGTISLTDLPAAPAARGAARVPIGV
jgi:proteasome lid subunit RPN8/RPN11